MFLKLIFLSVSVITSWNQSFAAGVSFPPNARVPNTCYLDVTTTDPKAILKSDINLDATPVFTDFARKPDGSLMLLYNIEADNYCKSIGAHLPSIRELALLATSYGAKGISEINNGKPNSTYKKIVAIDADGKLDAFYYSNEGYKASPGTESQSKLRSSSLDACDPTHTEQWRLFASDGWVQYEIANQHARAVRCVLD